MERAAWVTARVVAISPACSCCEIAPGGSSTPQRHLYEEVIYVLEGTGSTQVEFADGTKRSFEWGPRSLFAIPLNAKHRHFNGPGHNRALIVATTDLPLMLNMLPQRKIYLRQRFRFLGALRQKGVFCRRGRSHHGAAGQPHVGDEFRSDLDQTELNNWDDRGAGSRQPSWSVLADGTLRTHISEMPTGTLTRRAIVTAPALTS